MFRRIKTKDLWKIFIYQYLLDWSVNLNVFVITNGQDLTVNVKYDVNFILCGISKYYYVNLILMGSACWMFYNVY